MSDSSQALMTIRLMNGRILKFTYERAGDDVQYKQLVQRLYDARQMVLQLEDRTIIIPNDNIMMIEISPATKWLPDHALTGVKLAGQTDAG